MLTEQVTHLQEEFEERCKVFKESAHDPTDYTNMVCYMLLFLYLETVILSCYDPYY